MPRVVLDFLKSYPFDGIWLEHSVDEVLYCWGEVVWDEVSALLDLAEKLRHLVVVEGQ